MTYESKPVAYLRNRLFCPLDCITRRDRENYTTVITDYYPEWLTDEQGRPLLDEQRMRIPREDRDLVVKGYKVGEEYISFDRGDLRETYDYFHRRFKIIDQRVAPKLPYQLKFLGVRKSRDTDERWPLRPEQQRAVTRMSEEMYGIMDCNPRFGKTICACALTAETKLRTLVLVGQADLAKQFLKRLRSSTNIGAIERREGRRLAGHAKNLAEFKQFDICVTTWQKLHRNPGLLKSIKKLFGLVIVDEVHEFASQCTPRIVDIFWSKYKIGLTATPTRKDKREVIITNVIGPVTVKGRAKQVPLYVHPVYTKFCPDFKIWNTYMNKIMQSKTRNKLALKLIAADVKAGRKVLVSCVRVEHMRYLSAQLTKMGISNDIFFGGTKNREEFFDHACEAQFDVTIGNQRMLTGIDVPVWSAMHMLVPMNNPPKFYQVFSRIRTPLQGKTHAIFYDYLDACGASNGCYRSRHASYTNKEYAPILFVDENNNPLAKPPALKSIIAAANANEEGSLVYGDGAAAHADSSASDAAVVTAEKSANGWLKGHSRWSWRR